MSLIFQNLSKYIIIILGLACGLQAPLTYKYKYFGSVATGIPELSNQAAGWAMKADVEVFLEKDDGHAVFQVSRCEQDSAILIQE